MGEPQATLDIPIRSVPRIARSTGISAQIDLEAC